jgi:hypothetical protein
LQSSQTRWDQEKEKGGGRYDEESILEQQREVERPALCEDTRAELIISAVTATAG